MCLLQSHKPNGQNILQKVTIATFTQALVFVPKKLNAVV